MVFDQAQELPQAMEDSVGDKLALDGREAVRCSTGGPAVCTVEPSGTGKAVEEAAQAESKTQVEDEEVILQNLSRWVAEGAVEGCFEVMADRLGRLVPVEESLVVQESRWQCLLQSTEYSCSRRETLSPATREAWRYPRRQAAGQASTVQPNKGCGAC